MNEKLMASIRELAFQTGAQAIGVSPAARFGHAPKPYHPGSFLPDAKSVIVVGVHYPDACVEHCGNHDLQDMNSYGIVQVDMNVLLDILSFRIAKLLDRHGFSAVSFSTSHIWRYKSFGAIERDFTPDFPHRHAAVAAGLGEFGWNGLVLNGDYGPRIRFNSIVTGAELPPDPMYAGPALCDKCMRCVKYCRMDTFRKEVSGMDTVKIGEREYKFPLTNKWRCAWAEHFAIGLNVSIPDKINAQTVLAAKHEFGIYGGEIGNCLRQCLPPARREKTAHSGVNTWHRRKNVAKKDPAVLAGIISEQMRPLLDYLAVIPAEKLPADLQVNELPDTRAVILVGINLPKDLPDQEVLAHAGNIPASVQDALTFSREEVRRQLGTIGHRIAMLAEEHGYEAMPRIAVSVERLAALSGFGAYSGDGRVFRTACGTNSVFAAIAVNAVLPAYVCGTPPAVDKDCSRQGLEKTARDHGADLFGVTPLERLDKFAAVQNLRRLYPRLKNAIVIGMHYPEGYLDECGGAPMDALGPYSFAQYQTHRELGWTALSLCRRLAAAGHEALPLLDLCETASKTLNVRGTPPPDTNFDRGLIGLLPFAFIPDNRSNVFAAVAAGLGTIGYNGSVLTPQYGAKQRFICVVTDLDIAADRVSDFEAGCDKCRKCLSACPTRALNPEQFVAFEIGGRTFRLPSLDQMRCDWAKRFGLSGREGPAYMGSTTDVPPPEQIALADINAAMAARDPLQDHFNAIMEPCLKVCPVPWKKNESRPQN